MQVLVGACEVNIEECDVLAFVLLESVMPESGAEVWP